MAVASAGPYASLHFAPNRQPCQHPTTQFFVGRMPFLPINQQRQSAKVSKSRIIGARGEGLSGLEGLLAVVGLEVTTEGVRTGTGTEIERERVPGFRGCDAEAASTK